MADPTRQEVETDAFVRELSRDLAPVERIARLRQAALRVLGLWVAVSVAMLAAKGVNGPLAAAAGFASGFGAVLAGLSLVGLGGLVAALATAVPGREATARAASGLLAFGLLVAVGLGGWLLHGDPATAVPATLRSDAKCLGIALALALLPGLGALLHAVRAAPPRPAPVLWGIAAGCVALGAATTQLICADAAYRHVLASHALAPAFGAVLLMAPLWLGFRRLRPA